MGYPDEHVVQAKITIQRIDPPIWRQLLLPLALNLAGLHEIIQAAFGWTDSHLHQFIIGGLIYGAPEFDEDGQSTHATFEATDVLLVTLIYFMSEIQNSSTNTISAMAGCI